ncbi:MAG: helix-turn-helix domain-containing protein [Candidatus Omnitrophica bacterium]|nr:helix-turn-helix domain-containing protein [Candidatus Omnitrophota bacterium]
MSLTIGERLKSARESQKKSLDEVARATKIQRKILQAIEEGRLQEVLDPVYAKIFLKKYAAALELDGKALTQEYVALLGPEAFVPPLSLEPVSSREPVEESPLVKNVFVSAGLGMALLVALTFLGVLAFDLIGKPAPRPAAETPPPAKLIVPRSQPLKLTIRTKADVWMQVKSDGSVIFQNVLPGGSQESWSAREHLELWTGNAGAMEVVLNGKPLGSPGTGVKKGIRITREGMFTP